MGEAEPQLVVELMGPLTVRRGSEVLALPPSKKARALLAYLALTRRAHTRARLCDMFFDVADDPRAGLRWCLSRLRSAVDDSAHPVFVADRKEIAVDPAAIAVDVVDIRERCRSGAEDLDTDQLRALVDDLSGELLEGLDFTDLHAVQAWCLAERSEMRALSASLLTELIARIDDDPEQALPYARRLAAAEPLRDTARATIVRLLLAADRRAEAEEHYRAGLEELDAAGASTHALRVAWRREAAPSKDEAAAPPPVLEQMPGTPFVGRDAELETISKALDRAVEGRGNTVTVAGEAGVGKSRLIQELSRRARQRGVPVHVGACISAEGAPTYLPFIEALDAAVAARPREELGSDALLLEQILPSLSSRADPTAPRTVAEHDRYAVFHAAGQLLRQLAEPRGLVLVLEDLHWADTQSLLMLGYIARQLSGTKVLVVGTYRDVEVTRTHPLGETLSALRRNRKHERISLKRLDEGAALALIADLAELDGGAAEAIVRQTEGHPLFIEEVIKNLAEEGRIGTGLSAEDLEAVGLPEGIRDVIGRRLSRLSEPCNRMLACASVLTGAMEWPLLVEACEEGEETLLDLLDEALDARIIRERKDARVGSYEFTHALIRQALYEELTAPRRARLHRRIAEAMERAYADRLDSHLSTIAHHYFEVSTSGALGQFLHYSVRAGKRAMSLMAFEEAAGIYERALSALQDVDMSAHRDIRVDLNQRRGTVLAMLGRWAEANVHFVRALELVPEAEVARRARLHLRLGLSRFWQMDLAGLQENVVQARVHAEEAGESTLVAASIGFLAQVGHAEGDLSASRDHYREARELGGDPMDEPLLAHSLQHYPLNLHWQARYDEAIDAGRELIAVARHTSDGAMLMNLLPMCALALGAKGHYREANAVFREAQRFGRDHGIARLLARTRCMTVGNSMDLYDYETARENAEAALDAARTLDFVPTQVSARLDLLLIAVAMGELGAARDGLTDIGEAVARAAGWHGWVWRMRFDLARAQLAAAAGQWDECLALSSETMTQAESTGRRKHHVDALRTHASALVGLGRHAEAVGALRRGLEIARPIGYPSLTLRTSADLLGLADDPVAADEARAAVRMILAELDDPIARERFESSAPVKRVS